MIGLKRGSVELVPYNSKWPELFKQEAEILQAILGSQVKEIQHIGSTAIVGISAKPLIDIAIGIASMSDVQKIIEILENAGYHWRPKFGDISRHIVFAKGDETHRTHYIHVLEHNSKDWLDKIFFRDYLNTHPEARDEYEQLKIKFAGAFSDDRAAYTKQKDDFVAKILNLRI
jgi:GrpB-like predicted nucleotidyltransferase (UPF0157 family)